MNQQDRVTIIGPLGSAQRNKQGTILEPPDKVTRITVVQLDGEERPRNFREADLQITPPQG